MNRGRDSHHAQQLDVDTPIHPICTIYSLPVSRLLFGRSNLDATRSKGRLSTTAQGVERERPRSNLKALFQSKGYTFLVIGLCLICLGVFAPSFYLQVFASEKGVDVGLTSYTVAIINAASIIGTFPT